ncbi:MAG: mechanosensitive ion channel family protein [Thermoplasmata archaeon]|jgi:small conductance mechanosensitive channel
MTTLFAQLLPYLTVAVTLVLTWLLAMLVSWIIGHSMGESTPQVTGAVRRLGAVAVWLIGGTLAVQEVGLSPDILLLLIGLLGVAAVVALREPLENYAARYFSGIYTPFKLGDSIRILGFTGKVIEINAMTTVLLTDDEQLISVPNAEFMKQVVVNISPQAWKEVTIPITLSGNVDLPAFESALLKNLTKLKHRLDPRFPPVLTTRTRTAGSTDLTVTLMLRRPEERDAITLDVNKRIAEVMGRIS